MGRKRKSEKKEDEEEESGSKVTEFLSCSSVEYLSCQKLIYLVKNFQQYGLDKNSIHGFEGIIPETGIKTLYEELLGSLDCTPRTWPYGSHKVDYYKSKIGIGRIMPQNLSLIFMMRKIRYTITDEMYVDIDFVNCQPNIYVYLCQQYEIPKKRYKYLEEYTKDREDVIRTSLSINGDLTRDDVKHWFLKVLNGGNSDGCNMTIFMSCFYDEMSYLHKEIITKIEADVKYKHLRKHVTEKHFNDMYNIDCKIISLVLLDIENKMREVLKKYVKQHGYDWSVECFDGGMSYIKNNKQNVLDLNWDNAAFHVYEQTGVTCAIKASVAPCPIVISDKDLSTITYDDFLVFKHKFGTSYESLKYRFEQNNFFAADDVVYYCEDKFSIRQYSKTDFQNKYEHLWFEGVDKDGEPTKLKFITAWMTDVNKRAYNTVGLYPPGCEEVPIDPENPNNTKYFYSKWKGFRAEHIIPDGKDYADEVNVIRDHTLYLCNGNTEYRDFLERCIKHILVYPGKKIDMVIAFKALQGGEGKNTWWEIHKEIFGSQYCVSTQNPERDWFGDFNELLRDKIWVHMEEMSKDVLRRHKKQFLGYITSKLDTINLKGGKKISIPSYCNYFITFNNEGLDMFPGLKRRLFVHEMNMDTVIHNRVYYDKLYHLMKKPQAIRAYYDWLMSNVSIDEFKPVECRPMTPYMDRLFSKDELPRDRVEQYIQDKFVELFQDKFHPNKNTIRVMEWYVEYKERLKQDNAMQYLLNIQRFSQRLTELFDVNEGMEKKTVKGVATIKYDIDTVIQSMSRKNWFKLTDLGFDEDYMDMKYEVLIPCFKSCKGATVSSCPTAHLTDAMRAYKFFEKQRVEVYEHHCACGAHYRLQRIEPHE